MEKEKITELIEQKISEIEVLKQNVDRKKLDQWKKETELILEQFLERNSEHFRDFDRLNFRSSVFSMVDEEYNEIRNNEAYLADLDRAESILKGFVFGLQNNLI